MCNVRLFASISEGLPPRVEVPRLLYFSIFHSRLCSGIPVPILHSPHNSGKFIMEFSQVVKATDFDSVIGGSNPSTPASREGHRPLYIVRAVLTSDHLNLKTIFIK